MLVLPLIALGACGAFSTLTLSDCGADAPQALFATTAMLPLLFPTETLMLFEVETPDQPLGKTQV
jgi:hypothetical protein